MKKKNLLLIIVIVILVLMLIPVPAGQLRDGGSKVYKAVLYKITKLHRIPETEYIEKGYEYYSGVEIEILGFKVFDNTKLVWKSHDTIEEAIVLLLKKDTLTNKGATFVMKNNSTTETYEYGNPFYLEIKRNNEWVKLETINDLSFTLPAFGLQPGESKEFNINWEYGYGELKSGTYRLVKDVFRSGDEPIDESKKIYLYAEFTIE